MSLATRYREIREQTLIICAPLETEDYVIQPIPDVSPPKWHLGHTTWFFEEMVLVKYSPGYTRFNPQFPQLFNSYYKAAGAHWVQSERGQLSRPTVKEVLDYRHYVDEAVHMFLSDTQLTSEISFLIETGLHHEQQHQELLFMDIKYIFAANPLQGIYTKTPPPKCPKPDLTWYSATEGVYEIGFEGKGFAYDNERPKHKAYLEAFEIRNSLITNGEYLAFIQAGGYQKPLFWLSLGWEWVTQNKFESPLYWQKKNMGWEVFTFSGTQPLDLDAPVTHISYFEADAYANWAGARLPTEQESELFLRAVPPSDNPAWWWTQSHYSPYPGFRKFDGAIGEYNGKFMCNQFVLKGGCTATPKDHIRDTYRNFYQPHQRWLFSGLRLAKDLR